MNTYQCTCAHGTSYQIMEWNSLMDQVLWQLGIDSIFSVPYHPQSNGQLEVFHKYLKPTLKKLCEKDPANWDKDLNQVLVSNRVTPNLATAETPFFLVYGRDPNIPLHQLLEPMQHFLGDPDSRMLNIETHRLPLAIAKKTLDGNRFKWLRGPWKEHPVLQDGRLCNFKNKQPGKWDLKWRPWYRIVCIVHDEHFLHIENQATGKVCSCNMKDIILEPPREFCNIDSHFGRAGRYIKMISTITVNNYHISPLQHLIHDYLPTASSGRELDESVIFQSVLQAYQTCHSWIITAHVS